MFVLILAYGSIRYEAYGSSLEDVIDAYYSGYSYCRIVRLTTV